MKEDYSDISLQTEESEDEVIILEEELEFFKILEAMNKKNNIKEKNKLETKDLLLLKWLKKSNRKLVLIQYTTLFTFIVAFYYFLLLIIALVFNIIFQQTKLKIQLSNDLLILLIILFYFIIYTLINVIKSIWVYFKHL